MSEENARKFLEEKNLGDHIIEIKESTATVELAAQALGVSQGEIAKSLTFWSKDHEPILILMAGDKRVDNKKFKALFETKAKMLTPEEVAQYIGHEVGGVCPFGLKEGVKVYMDQSLKDYQVVYPACGSHYLVARFDLDQLEYASEAQAWVDISKE